MIGGLIALGVFVAFVVWVMWAGRGITKLQKELPDRVARAKPAKATVTAIRRGSIQHENSNHVAMEIELSVRPDGGEPYAATAFWEVLDIHVPSIQPGAVLDVKIDAADPRAVYSPHFEVSLVPLATLLAADRRAP